jgi:hypothetical protein
MNFTTKTAAAWLAVSIMLSGSTVLAHPDHSKSEEAAQVRLTDEQKKELSAIHDQILTKKKELIAKYVQFGVITEDKAKEILGHMEARHSKLEKNNYIIDWHMKSKQK